MNLTKEDLDAIRTSVREEIHEQNAPIREAMRQLLVAQVEIVEKVDKLENRMNILLHHFSLTQTSRELKKTLQTLD